MSYPVAYRAGAAIHQGVVAATGLSIGAAFEGSPELQRLQLLATEALEMGLYAVAAAQAAILQQERRRRAAARLAKPGSVPDNQVLPEQTVPSGVAEVGPVVLSGWELSCSFGGLPNAYLNKGAEYREGFGTCETVAGDWEGGDEAFWPVPHAMASKLTAIYWHDGAETFPPGYDFAQGVVWTRSAGALPLSPYPLPVAGGQVRRKTIAPGVGRISEFGRDREAPPGYRDRVKAPVTPTGVRGYEVPVSPTNADLREEIQRVADEQTVRHVGNPTRAGFREHEVKVRLSGQVGQVYRIFGRSMNVVTETGDLVEAFWESLPSYDQTNGAKANMGIMLKDIVQHWRDIDPVRAAMNVAFNQLQDMVVGKVNSTIAKDFADKMGSPVGPHFGPAF